MIKYLRVLIVLLLILFCSLQAFAQKSDSATWESHISVPGKTGTQLVIYGKVIGSNGNPLKGADLWIYHTDAGGFYAKDESGNDQGWRQADYSARLQSGPDGNFEIHTIRPAGYPNSINPAHLHIRINAPGYPELEYTAYFEGGDRITGEIKNLVEKYGTMFLLPVETSDKDDTQKVIWHIKLLTESPY